ncbi:hypothetical protein ACFPRL_08070 [Pseudoclavibacter helvolus]
MHGRPLRRRSRGCHEMPEGMKCCSRGPFCRIAGEDGAGSPVGHHQRVVSALQKYNAKAIAPDGRIESIRSKKPP